MGASCATRKRGLSATDQVTTPAIFVHGEGCVLPEHVKQIHTRLRSEKKLVWIEGAQADFYDRPELVARAVAPVAEWFGRTLKG